MQEGIKLEEDPETGPNNVDAGDRWRALLAWLFQAVCEKGRIPIQLGWEITVLIPKGGRRVVVERYVWYGRGYGNGRLRW